MTLSTEEKAQRSRDRMLEGAKQYSTGTYIRKFVAPLFQQMIRAEFAADKSPTTIAIVNGEVKSVGRRVGQCVCVTCGKVDAWDSGIKGIHCGHFLASRRNSILLEEANTAPQCARCNVYETGKPESFRLWMLAVRPLEIERLQQLKNTVVTFTRDELVDMRTMFGQRLKVAKKAISIEQTEEST